MLLVDNGVSNYYLHTFKGYTCAIGEERNQIQLQKTVNLDIDGKLIIKMKRSLIADAIDDFWIHYAEDSRVSTLSKFIWQQTV